MFKGNEERQYITLGYVPLFSCKCYSIDGQLDLSIGGVIKNKHSLDLQDNIIVKLYLGCYSVGGSRISYSLSFPDVCKLVKVWSLRKDNILNLVKGNSVEENIILKYENISGFHNIDFKFYKESHNVDLVFNPLMTNIGMLSTIISISDFILLMDTMEYFKANYIDINRFYTEKYISFNTYNMLLDRQSRLDLLLENQNELVTTLRYLVDKTSNLIFEIKNKINFQMLDIDNNIDNNSSDNMQMQYNQLMVENNINDNNTSEQDDLEIEEKNVEVTLQDNVKVDTNLEIKVKDYDTDNLNDDVSSLENELDSFLIENKDKIKKQTESILLISDEQENNEDTEKKEVGGGKLYAEKRFYEFIEIMNSILANSDKSFENIVTKFKNFKFFNAISKYIDLDLYQQKYKKHFDTLIDYYKQVCISTGVPNKFTIIWMDDLPVKESWDKYSISEAIFLLTFFSMLKDKIDELEIPSTEKDIYLHCSNLSKLYLGLLVFSILKKEPIENFGSELTQQLNQYSDVIKVFLTKEFINKVYNIDIDFFMNIDNYISYITDIMVKIQNLNFEKYIQAVYNTLDGLVKKKESLVILSLIEKANIEEKTKEVLKNIVNDYSSFTDIISKKSTDERIRNIQWYLLPDELLIGFFYFDKNLNDNYDTIKFMSKIRNSIISKNEILTYFADIEQKNNLDNKNKGFTDNFAEATYLINNDLSNTKI